MKKYEQPELKIEAIEVEDIITSSPSGGSFDDEGELAG